MTSLMMNILDNATMLETTFDQDGFWDSDIFPLPLSGSIEYAGDYQTVPLDMNFAFENSYTPNISTPASDATGSSSTEQRLLPPLRWASIETTPDNKSSKQPKILLEPRPQTQARRRTRKPPSGVALERRRQQNRAAQLAFRERSKRQVLEMREELTLCSDYNQKMYSCVQTLLNRTDALKREIEAALAMKPPVVSSFDSSDNSRTSSMELHSPPDSATEEPHQDDEDGIYEETGPEQD